MHSFEVEKLPVIISLKCTTYAIFTILGAIGNASILYSIRTNTAFHSIPYYYIANLALADLLYSLMCIPPLFIRSITDRWILGNAVCNLVGLLNHILGVVSIWSLVVIGMNRICAVKFPLQFRSSARSAKLNLSIILAVWTLSLGLAVPPIFGLGEYFPGRNSCYINGRKATPFAMFVISVGFGIPAMLIIAIYTFLFASVRQIQTKRYANIKKGVIQMPDSSKSDEVKPEDKTNGEKKEGRKKEDFKTTKLMIYVFVTYFCCWTPYVFGAILYSFKIEPEEFGFFTLGVITASLNSVLNPIIYTYNDGRLRKHILKLLRFRT